MARTAERYVCQVTSCDEHFVTARGFKVHADRDHADLSHANRAQARREIVTLA